MKNSRAFTLIEVVIVIVIIGLLAGMMIPACAKVKQVKHREEVEQARENECAHKWSRWTQPVTSSDWYNGTRQFQSRTCEKCGLAETRRTQIAPGK